MQPGCGPRQHKHSSVPYVSGTSPANSSEGRWRSGFISSDQVASTAPCALMGDELPASLPARHSGGTPTGGSRDPAIGQAHQLSEGTSRLSVRVTAATGSHVAGGVAHSPVGTRRPPAKWISKVTRKFGPSMTQALSMPPPDRKPCGFLVSTGRDVFPAEMWMCSKYLRPWVEALNGNPGKGTPSCACGCSTNAREWSHPQVWATHDAGLILAIACQGGFNVSPSCSVRGERSRYMFLMRNRILLCKGQQLFVRPTGAYVHMPRPWPGTAR